MESLTYTGSDSFVEKFFDAYNHHVKVPGMEDIAQDIYIVWDGLRKKRGDRIAASIVLANWGRLVWRFKKRNASRVDTVSLTGPLEEWIQNLSYDKDPLFSLECHETMRILYKSVTGHKRSLLRLLIRHCYTDGDVDATLWNRASDELGLSRKHVSMVLTGLRAKFKRISRPPMVL